MSLIAALLPDSRHRDSLRRSGAPLTVLWAESWQELNRMVRVQPVRAALADTRAEPRKDGILRVLQFSQRFPLTPMIVWGDPDARELYRLGKAGATQILLDGDAANPLLVLETVTHAARDPLQQELIEMLEGSCHPDGLEMIAYALERIPDRIQVPSLATAFGLSVSTLERRCEQWRIPTPGRLLLWLRVLNGLHWLREPGRSVESVALQLGYSSGAALRRAAAALAGRGSGLSDEHLFPRARHAFLRECGAAAVTA